MICIGQERFRNITTSYYRGSQGVVVVYDLTQFETLTKVTYWINELKKENVDGVIMLAGNKLDCVKGITKEQEDVIKTIGLPEFKCSAKSAEGVEELFTSLIEKVLERGVQTENVGKMEEVSLGSKKEEEKKCCYLL